MSDNSRSNHAKIKKRPYEEVYEKLRKIHGERIEKINPSTIKIQDGVFLIFEEGILSKVKKYCKKCSTPYSMPYKPIKLKTKRLCLSCLSENLSEEAILSEKESKEFISRSHWIKQGKRKCLTCGEIFISEGFHNRRCESCCSKEERVKDFTQKCGVSFQGTSLIEIKNI